MTRALAPLVLLVATGCGFPKTGLAPSPLSVSALAAASQRWPDATEASLSEGRAKFLATCNGCHGYPDLQAVPEARWPEAMKRMGGKADLTPAQADAVLRFVLSARGESPSATP